MDSMELIRPILKPWGRCGEIWVWMPINTMLTLYKIWKSVIGVGPISGSMMVLLKNSMSMPGLLRKKAWSLVAKFTLDGWLIGEKISKEKLLPSITNNSVSSFQRITHSLCIWSTVEPISVLLLEPMPMAQLTTEVILLPTIMMLPLMSKALLTKSSIASEIWQRSMLLGKSQSLLSLLRPFRYQLSGQSKWPIFSATCLPLHSLSRPRPTSSKAINCRCTIKDSFTMRPFLPKTSIMLRLLFVTLRL